MEATAQRVHALNAEWKARHLKTKHVTQLLENAASEERRVKLRLDATITRLAREECLRLADLMYRKLPVELRNAVYEYLCVEDQSIPVGPYYHFRHYEFRSGVKFRRSDQLERRSRHFNDNVRGRIQSSRRPELEVGADSVDVDIDVPEREKHFTTLPDGRIEYDHTSQRPTDVLFPSNHIFNTKYVGPEIALETQRFYYANNTFSICNVDNGLARFLYHAIHTDLEEDERLGYEGHDDDSTILPYEHVHDLQIRIKHEHLGSFIGCALQDYTPTTAERFAYERNFLRRIKRSLKPLLKRPLGERTRNIEIILMTSIRDDDVDDIRTFGNLLQAVRNTIYQLLYDTPNTSIRVIHSDELILFPRNITPLWSLSKEQWEHEKSVNDRVKDWMEDFLVGDTFNMESGYVGGYHGDRHSFVNAMMHRWGTENVFTDTKPRQPIKECWYWPVYRGALPPVDDVDRTES